MPWKAQISRNLGIQEIFFKGVRSLQTQVIQEFRTQKVQDKLRSPGQAGGVHNKVRSPEQALESRITSLPQEFRINSSVQNKLKSQEQAQESRTSSRVQNKLKSPQQAQESRTKSSSRILNKFNKSPE